MESLQIRQVELGQRELPGLGNPKYPVDEKLQYPHKLERLDSLRQRLLSLVPVALLNAVVLPASLTFTWKLLL